VDVVVGHDGHIEVDDVAQLLHVDPTRGDVGGDEHAVRALLEAVERLRALRLRTVAVNPCRFHPLGHERCRETVRAVLRPRENERFSHQITPEELEEERSLEALGHRVDRLRDARGRSRLTLEVDARGVLEHLACEGGDLGRHRRAEEERLALVRNVAQHASNGGEEAHVEHPVRFIQDEELDAFELGVRLLEVIQKAAWRGDDHVHACPERMLLRAHAHAAVYRRGRQGRVHRERIQVLMDLCRQLARRREDERPCRAARPRDQLIHDRQEERGSLAAPGLRAREEIASADGDGNRLGLNGSGLNESQLPNAGEKAGVQREGRKGHRVERASRRGFGEECGQEGLRAQESG
jgi:hypothetical protein